MSVPVEIYSIASLEAAAVEFQELVRVHFEDQGDDVRIDLEVLSDAYPTRTIVSEFLNYLLDTAAQMRLQREGA